MPEPWTFALVTDSHLGQGDGSGVHNPSSGSRIAERLRRLGPALAGCEFVIHAGDVVEHGTPEELAAAAELLRGWPCPVRISLGNHDATEPGQRERWPELYPEGFLGPDLYGSFTHRGVHFALLQAWWRDAAGTAHPYWERRNACLWEVPAEQLAWLDQDLAAHRDEPTVVVHHPLSVALSARLTGAEAIHQPPVPESVAALDAVLAKHPQVVMLAGGHAHAHQVERVGRLWHVAAGCLTEYPYEYRTVTVAPGEWRVATHRLPADEAMQSAAEVPAPWVAGRAEDREAVIPVG